MAQMSLAETAATTLKLLPGVLKVGVGTTFQLVPFHCSVRVWEPEVPICASPTAHTSLLETTATPLNPSDAPTLGFGATLQLVPFQCSISVWLWPLEYPTAQT